MKFNSRKIISCFRVFYACIVIFIFNKYKYNQYKYIYINNYRHEFIYTLIDIVGDVLILIDSRLLASANAIVKIATCKWLTLELVASSTSWHPPSLTSLRERRLQHRTSRF